MSHVKAWKHKEIIIAFFAVVLVLYVHGAIPFLMVPTLGQAVWTTGFSQSMASGSLFDFYARDFGIPKPAAIAFGLAGAWPASLLIRLGMHAADAYSAMAALWLGLAMFSAYRLARWFGGAKLIALALAVVWMTMPIIWAHAGYSMMSLGIALLSFYFLAACKLFLFDNDLLKITPASIALYVIAAIVSVFMDGYTFMMFASGSSILLLYMLLTRIDARSKLLKVAAPVHVISFALAYALYSLHIGKINYEAHSLDWFRGWGLDLSFLAIPTKGVLWIPDLLGISVARSSKLYFGDASVWLTTFALPVIVLGLLSWFHVRRLTKIASGILLVSMFGFYMALGPSLKINSVKPGQQGAAMASEHAVAPTGNAWISAKLPGFNVMRASYRWSALGIFALWLLIVICLSRADKKDIRVSLALLPILFLLNLPDPEKRWLVGTNNRIMFQQIDQELVAELHKSIRPNETVAFLPWGNDFMANYIAPKVGFRTFNIGGDKNLSSARSQWPQEMHVAPNRVRRMTSKIDASEALRLRSSALSLLENGVVDVVIVPFFDMLWAPHSWPCPGGSYRCLAQWREFFDPFISSLSNDSGCLDIADTELFVVLSTEHRCAQILGLGEEINLEEPVTFSAEGVGGAMLGVGWSYPESWGTWSDGGAASILVPNAVAGKPITSLAFTARVFLTANHPKQRVKILINNVFYSEIEFLEPEARFSILVADDKVPKNARVVRIDFEFPDAARPVDLEVNGDGRRLALGLKEMKLN